MGILRSRWFCSALLGLSFFSVSHAQTEPEIDGVQKPLWEAGVAGFGLTGPAYPGAEDDVGRALALLYKLRNRLGVCWRTATRRARACAGNHVVASGHQR